MNTDSEQPPTVIESMLTETFFLDHPKEAARALQSLPIAAAAQVIDHLPAKIIASTWSYILPGTSSQILLQVTPVTAQSLLANLNLDLLVATLNGLNSDQQKHFLSMTEENTSNIVKDLMAFPADSAGAIMDCAITACYQDQTVAEALHHLKRLKIRDLNFLHLLSEKNALVSRVPVQRLALAHDTDIISTLSDPIPALVSILDPKSEVVDKLEKFKLDSIPVMDGNDRFVGLIRSRNIVADVKDVLTTDMVTMVGASKEERALSSSLFAVKKRLPWLQINLLTAFLAAAVVGMFEATIAKYTALAILLPIAAGQSGNTGAQALAVTMRGLTLREITVRQWLPVVRKEAGAALINGVAVAITCGGGIYIWSQSLGLALIIALAMITSMLLAAISGALVPIILKRIGQDPALSSSIILTTVTDIAGFMSFLGIATALSGMLDAG